MFRAIDKWLAGYLASAVRRPWNVPGPKHLVFCVADHFEPFQDKAGKRTALGKVEEWCGRFPALAGAFRDSDGVGPQYTFFYPQEEYDADCLDKLAEICGKNLGEVEIQLHHRNDTPAGFQSKLEGFRDVLRGRHGLLGADSDGKVRYGFVHGNWALCNSRPDGDWCGVNEEIGILRRSGCYADFTFPSAPSPTQPRMVNAIYYASDTGQPGAAEKGKPVISNQTIDHRPQTTERSQESEVRTQQPGKDHRPQRESSIRNPAIGNRQSEIGNDLMLITGPLALDWRRRKWGLLPRLENGAITAVNPPLPGRIDSWARQGIHVEGRPEWVFVKVYTHGCRRENMDVLLGEAMRVAFDYLTTAYNDGRRWVLHFVTAREMYNIVRAAEEGKSGNPGNYRDYEISKPPICARTGVSRSGEKDM